MLNTKIKLSEKITNVLEEKDFKIFDVEEQDGSYYVEIEIYSPAGENVIETIWFDGTDKSFIKGVRELADGFDPDEHAEMWVDERGKNGVPETIRELLEDAEAIKEIYKELAEALEKLDFE